MTTENPSEQDIGIVYALTNKAMPDLVKIGFTGRDDVQARMKELFSTGVPYPFECIEAVRIDDFKHTERLMHRVFEPDRYYEGREFFNVSVEQVQALFELLKGEDAKPEVQQGIENAISPTLPSGRQRRPKTYLSELDIPDNAELKFVAGRGQSADEVIAIVVDAAKNRLTLKSEESNETASTASEDTVEDYSFSRLTAILLDGKAKNVPGWDYWEYEGETLSIRRDDSLNSVA